MTAIPSIAHGVFMQLMGPSSAGFMYSDTGGGGPPVVFFHGVLMNGTLWDDIVDSLCDRYRCIIPELPFGAHRTPMPDDADLRLESLVKMVVEFAGLVLGAQLWIRARNSGW